MNTYYIMNYRMIFKKKLSKMWIYLTERFPVG